MKFSLSNQGNGSLRTCGLREALFACAARQFYCLRAVDNEMCFIKCFSYVNISMKNVFFQENTNILFNIIAWKAEREC